MALTGILIARFVTIVLLPLPGRDNGHVWYGCDGDAGGGDAAGGGGGGGG